MMAALRTPAGRSCSLALAPALALCSAPAAFGADKDWINSAGGFFEQTTNWDPTGVPGSADRAIFNLNGAYTVSFLGNRTNSRLLVARDNVTFDLNGQHYTLAGTGSTSLVVGVAGPIGGAGRLTVSDGSLTAHAGEIGTGSGSLVLGGNGTVTVGTGGALRFNSLLTVGSLRGGNVIVNEGGDLFTNHSTVGLNAPGNVTLTGPGSLWSATSWINVGATAAGAINITGGGGISQTGAGAQTVIADLPAGSGILNIDGAGSRWINADSDVFIGNEGDATVTITTGGLLSATGGDTIVSRTGTSTSQMTIGGADAAFVTNSIYIGGSPTFGAGGVGTVTINPGGRLQTANAGITRIIGNGRLNLAGGTLRTSDLDSSASRFNWTSGTLHLTNATPLPIIPGGVLGNNPTIGTGMTLRVNDLYLSTGSGTLSPARLTISGGGIVTSNSARVGAGFMGDSIVTIDGAGSSWTTNALTVGSFGHATMTISNGARLVSGSLNAPGIEIAATTLSTSRVIVNGPGSSWDASTIPTAQGFLRVGSRGDGRLEITGGGNVTNDFTHAQIGSESGSTGSVLVEGAGSTWDVGYFLTVGHMGNGSLTISDGGNVLADSAFVGYAITGRGSLSLAGADSRLEVGTFNVAHAGHATVTIGTGATIHATRTIMAEDAFSDALIRVNGGSLHAGTMTTMGPAAHIRYGAGSLQAGHLQMTGGASITLDAAAANVLETTGVNIDSVGGSIIDLTDNFVIVDYTGTSPMTDVEALVGSAYDGGNWGGGGIGSSLADDSTHGIGYAEAADLFGSFPAVFAGRTVDDSSVLIAYARYGDANLDGLVNLQDFNRLAANFGQTDTDWARGDFTYDGLTNLQDFNRLAANFGLSAGPDGVVDPSDWAALAAAVPEPVAGVTGGIAVALLARRRRRRPLLDS